MNPLNIRGGMRNATYRGSMHREQIEEDRLRETSFGRTIGRQEKPSTIKSIPKILFSIGFLDTKYDEFIPEVKKDANK